MLDQILIAIDQLLNTLVWLKCDGSGYADESLSARAWRLREYSKMYKVIDTIFFWQSAHCLISYNSEVKRRQLPKEYREQ
ncbi:hypothetical protein M0R04_04070 [Candidatus Dojkabacteria bacterium]|jgi:hypothetical protein|nr:hypothetical protein [Candidatus Dojkabacteria bacterium]